MAELTQARMRLLFNYDPGTGSLIWRPRGKEHFKTPLAFEMFHARFAGKVAGHLNAQNYRVINVDGFARLAHKLIWLHVFGEWIEYPKHEIDHVNGDRSDNRLQNLRKVTKSENQRNAGQRRNNTSGVHGVNWKPKYNSDPNDGRWVARIWNGPRHVYLGSFTSLHEARIARKAAERVLGFTGTEREAR